MVLLINTIQTETMCIEDSAEFFIDSNKISNVNHFKSLGSYITSDYSVKEELAARIQTVLCAFGRLRKKVFDSHDWTISRLLVLNAISNVWQ